jgi:calcineurin-like phosphoesterase family protein
MIWFTADWHLDHANILVYEPERPWKTIAKMNDGLKDKYNSIVEENDVVYFLGDMSLRGPENWAFYQRWLRKIKGEKHLILGNHDKLNPFLYVDCGFTTVHTALQVEEFILVHDPAVTIVDKSKKWLVGHIHSLFKKQKHCLNVGIDVWNYFPVSIDQVRREFEDTSNS